MGWSRRVSSNWKHILYILYSHFPHLDTKVLKSNKVYEDVDVFLKIETGANRNLLNLTKINALISFVLAERLAFMTCNSKRL